MREQKIIRSRKLISIFIGVIGSLFLIIAFFMMRFGGNILGIDLPSPDISHIGFILVGSIYIITALAIWLSVKDKKSIIEDSDERNEMIDSKAGLIAYTVQSSLLLTTLF